MRIALDTAWPCRNKSYAHQAARRYSLQAAIKAAKPHIAALGLIL